MSSTRITALVLLLATGSVSCNTEEKKQCRGEYARAQSTVKGVDSASLESVERSVHDVDLALARCESAGLDAETTQLEAVRKQLTEHLRRLRSKRSLPERQEQTPAQIAKLEKDGDPDCPKGQAYKHRATGKEIRCTGPQPIDLGFAAAETYFKKRDYSVRPGSDPATLELEHGSELLRFRYERKGDSKPPKCVIVYPPQGTSWQEATARLSGTAPWVVDRKRSVETTRGDLPLDVTDTKDKVVVRIGSCD